jgi:hypothetical protein
MMDEEFEAMAPVETELRFEIWRRSSKIEQNLSELKWYTTVHMIIVLPKTP